jgi:apolipoprotein N-acyltransferase
MLKFILIFILGILTPLRFTPIIQNTINVVPFACFAFFFVTIKDMSPKKTFLAGLTLGIAYFSSGLYWIYHAIHHYGNASIFISSLITVLLILTLSLFIAMPVYLTNLVCKKTSPLKKVTLLYPASMMVFEWLRGHLIFSGFPWLLIGYSQTHTIIGSLAPIIGVLGLSLTVYSISGLVASLSMRFTKKQGQIASLTLFFILCASVYAGTIKFTYTDHLPINIALIQGNIKQSLKYQPNELDNNINTYYKLTEQALKEQGKHTLVVWPEGAIPAIINANNVQPHLAKVKQLLRKYKSYLISGTMYTDPNTSKTYNTVVRMSYLPNAKNQYYFKHNIVPFGEYFPLQFITKPLMDSLNIPFSQLSAGAYNQPTMRVDNYTVAPFICFDAAYSNFVADNTKGKSLIVIVSDDSWFGDTIALQQQLQMTQMRARETGRFILVTNNSGITALISPNGKIYASIKKHKKLTLLSYVRLSHGNTPFMVWGYTLPWIFACLMLLLGVLDITKLYQRKQGIRF